MLNFVPLAQVQAVHNIVVSSVVYFSITTPLRPIHDSPVSEREATLAQTIHLCSLGVSLISLVLQLAMSCFVLQGGIDSESSNLRGLAVGTSSSNPETWTGGLGAQDLEECSID